MYSASLGGSDAFRLALLDVFALCLRHVVQKLKNDVRNQGSGQIASLPGIQQGHIEHHNIYLLLFRKNPPLLQNFIIVSAKPVDALNHDNATQWLSNFAKKYGLPPIHPHKFRHTMASLLIYNGTDTLTVSKRLGHAQVSTTTDIYSHAIKEADERAAESIADVILRRA